MADVEAPQARVGPVEVHVHVEVDGAAVAVRAVGEQFDVVVRHRVAPLVHHADHELLPPFELRELVPGRAARRLLPRLELARAVHGQRPEHKVHERTVRLAHDGAVVLARHRPERHRQGAHGLDVAAVRAVRLRLLGHSRVAGEVQRDLAGVEAATRPADGAVGALLAGELADAAVALRAAQDEHVRGV